MKRPVRPAPKGDVLDLHGATVIEPGQFMANMALRNIVIPEGVTEIGERAFYSCMALETVVLPKTMKKIGKMAFMSCRALRQVEIPEGVEEICDHAFGATNNLKEVYLPDSLQRVDRYIFGLGGDSPYATAYMSGELASRLQASSKDSRFLSAISARRYVIDGVGYDNMYDYGKSDTSSSGFTGSVDEKSFDEYRDEMEEACKEGKPLQDMIEAGRKAVSADEYGDKDAFEQAIKNLDKNATVSFSGKHFVLTGFGSYESDIIAEIEKRGGKVHSSMVKMADYLVVCLESPGAAKVKKALEWREKGAANLIVSDYQMWQAIFGKTSATSSGTTRKSASSTGATRKTSPSSGGTKKAAPSTGTTKKAASESGSTSSTTARRKTQPSQLTELENSVNSAASELSQASDRPLTAEERKAVQEAQGILENMQSQMSSTSSALEVHQENLRKQEEEKQRRMEEAKKKACK